MHQGDQMNSNPNFELPQPANGETAPGKGKVEALPGGAEAGSANRHVQAAPQLPAQDPAALAQPSHSVAVNNTQATAAPPAAAQADDTDLIEKEWVERAKSIVQKTRDDPFLQNREIHKMKAEYIEKRWQKKLKLADETRS